MLFVVDGNIGAGKTTLLRALEQKYETYIVLYEPLHEWTESSSSDTLSILEMFYTNPTKYAFELQMAILRARFNLLYNHIEHINNPHTVVIAERSVHTDLHIFGSLLYKDGLLSESQNDILTKWVDTLTCMFPAIKYPTGYVFLDKSVNTCIHQITKRSRSQETNINVQYVERLHDQHQTWFDTASSNSNSLRLNDDDNDTNVALLHNFIKIYRYEAICNEIVGISKNYTTVSCT